MMGIILGRFSFARRPSAIMFSKNLKTSAKALYAILDSLPGSVFIMKQ
jgi:hypothetical protein